jgi:hypothetical protein
MRVKFSNILKILKISLKNLEKNVSSNLKMYWIIKNLVYIYFYFNYIFSIRKIRLI